MLWSLVFYQQFSGDLNSSLEIAYQLLQLAEDLKDGALTTEAHRSIGAALVLLGRCSEALDHLEKGAILYPIHHSRLNRVFTSFESKVMFECFAAMALLPLGFPDKSAARLAAGLAFARELGHPQTLAVALHIAAQLHQFRGDAPQVLVYANEAMELADEHGLTLWVAMGLIEVGWAEAELRDRQNGIQKIKRGLAQYELTGTKLRLPYLLALLADQLSKTGQAEEGIAVITKATALAETIGEGYVLPELHRIKGELFLKTSDLKRSDPVLSNSSLSQARACFVRAITVAKQQGTKWLELRAALDIYRLDLILGKSNHAQLAETYSSFTEGHETADLRQARALLNEVPIGCGQVAGEI